MRQYPDCVLAGIFRTSSNSTMPLVPPPRPRRIAADLIADPTPLSCRFRNRPRCRAPKRSLFDYGRRRLALSVFDGKAFFLPVQILVDRIVIDHFAASAGIHLSPGFRQLVGAELAERFTAPDFAKAH